MKPPLIEKRTDPIVKLPALVAELGGGDSMPLAVTRIVLYLRRDLPPQTLPAFGDRGVTLNDPGSYGNRPVKK
ncbi:MAG TPA: hypothetical protein VNM39_01975 [Verrucomicrobiae bacterium]|nr:hypothetical protein [Verrucomicrobiae bacterium]